MPLLIVLAVLFGAWLVWSRWLFWSAARKAREAREDLAALPAEKLVEEVRRLIRFERWERFRSADRILSSDEWTDASLLDGLKDLRAEVAAEQPGNVGRDSNLFEFYDCGLMSIVELLQKRTG